MIHGDERSDRVRAGGARSDREWLLDAIELSRRCPPATGAYAVGAIIVDAAGRELVRAFSRETDPTDHAEESALAKLAAAGIAPAGATMVSSLEPCSTRRSHPRTCTDLIVESGLRRVVFALREPPVFVDCRGAELLAEAGLEVVELPELGHLVREINANVLGRRD
jgi:diaminohydroxyphosphoribosylaminopyrimidine deaminase/5-amino-6-(5-phosphoribosylamino)uracil reductase